MHRHHENEYEMSFRDCNWLCMFFTEGGNERGGNEIKTVSNRVCVCVCVFVLVCVGYLEVLHERP